MAALACLLWAWMSTVANGNLDSQFDMLENYAWSQSFRWGTHKHPPLFAWVVGAWFAVFPQTDWAYRLLSYANVWVALAGVAALGRRLGLGTLAQWGALLLLWSFPYTTLAGKFNANSQLLPLWPWTAALLLASWRASGWRGGCASVLLGLLAAACMLGKYYSGVFLAGLLAPVFLHPQGRRWLLTPRPWLALAVFALALWPHLDWVAQHGWATLAYAADQNGGQTVWRHVLRFALSPLLYWLPAWLALCLAHAAAGRREAGGWRRAAVRAAWQSWCPQGWGDTLFWLAFAPWALTLGFGVAGVAELSIPWAIPIGYAFSLLWLRNLRALDAAALNTALARLQRAWWPALAVALALALGVAAFRALTGQADYYRPSQEAAQAIVQDWQARHPGQTLHWAGGEWAENAMLAFYAQPNLHTVPGLPDSLPARLTWPGPWQSLNGLLLCPLGPLSQAPQPAAVPATPCVAQAQAWLAARGQPAAPRVLTAQRHGWAFPRAMPFAYAVFDVPAATPAP